MDVVAYALVILVAAGCSNSLERAKVSDRIRLIPAAKPAGVKDHYLAVTATGNGGSADIPLVGDIYGTCRCEFSAGLFDVKHADLGGGSFQAVFASASGDVVTLVGTAEGAGLRVVATKTPGDVAIGEIIFPAAQIVDLALETDGSRVTVTGRAHGDPQFAVLGVTDLFGIGPHQATLGVRALKKGAVVGFDGFRVTKRGHRARQLKPSQQALDAIYTATDLLVEALHAADGAADLPAVGSNATAALTPIENGLAALDPAEVGKERTAAIHALETAQRRASALAKAIADGKKGDRIYKAAMKAVSAIADAAGATAELP